MIFLFFLFMDPTFAAPAVLSKSDLKKAPILASINELKGQSGNASIFWVCFEKPRTSLKVRCDEKGPEEFLDANAVLEVVATDSRATFDYWIRHAISIEECRALLRGVRKVQKKNLPYCILGDLVGLPRHAPGGPQVNSVYYELKSPLGRLVEFDIAE